MELKFLTPQQVRWIGQNVGTPVYVYHEPGLIRAAEQVLAFPNAFGSTGRFAIKACPTGAVLRLFDSLGLHFDASSAYEVARATRLGIPHSKISLTAQQLPSLGDLHDFVTKRMKFNACSLHQLEQYGKLLPGTEVGIRVNPGLGSGGNNRTNVGGPASSFGIWHEYLELALEIAEKYRLTIVRVHTHIGSGSDPEIWKKVAGMSLDITKRVPSASCLSLGGGFKVARMSDEHSTDLRECGLAVLPLFEEFYRQTGRKLEVEIEPGTFLVANHGCIIATVVDKVDTGPNGYKFLKVDSGMTENARPALYGAQHPLDIVFKGLRDSEGTEEVLVVGHCCESGDTWTPQPGDSEGLLPRELPIAEIGDYIVMGGAGAYCASMPIKHYNSFPEAPEVLVHEDGTLQLIRKRQTWKELVENEV
jgi:diaminopimelate decarboxylase